MLPSVSAPHNSGDLAHLPAPGRVTPENGSVYAAAEALRWPSTARPSPSAARRGAPRTARGSRRGRPRLPAAQHPGQLHHPPPPPPRRPSPAGTAPGPAEVPSGRARTGSASLRVRVSPEEAQARRSVCLRDSTSCFFTPGLSCCSERIQPLYSWWPVFGTSC